MDTKRLPVAHGLVSQQSSRDGVSTSLPGCEGPGERGARGGLWPPPCVSTAPAAPRLGGPPPAVTGVHGRRGLRGSARPALVIPASGDTYADRSLSWLLAPLQVLTARPLASPCGEQGR